MVTIHSANRVAESRCVLCRLLIAMVITALAVSDWCSAQEAQLFQELTVHQVFRIFGKLRGLSSKDAPGRADQLISDLHLEEHRNVTTEKLSGGLRRRS